MITTETIIALIVTAFIFGSFLGGMVSIAMFLQKTRKRD